MKKECLDTYIFRELMRMHILIRMALWVETSSDTVPGVPCIDGISCDKVVLYEKLPIKQTMLKDILELTQGLKKAGPCAGFCGLWCAKCTGSQVW